MFFLKFDVYLQRLLFLEYLKRTINYATGNKRGYISDHRAGNRY
jgi:hypothetical protein